MKIYLDDIRPAPKGWVLVKTASECIELIEGNMGNVLEIDLDHDLGLLDDNGNDIETGYTVLLWLENWARENVKDVWKIPKVKIHTANPIARNRMEMSKHQLEGFINSACSI